MVRTVKEVDTIKPMEETHIIPRFVFLIAGVAGEDCRLYEGR